MEITLTVGLTLSAKQIRNAPREVRRWLEQELLASFGLQPPSAEPNAAPLVACSEEEAGKAARAHNNRTAAYLLAKPLLSNHLEDALSQFGISCDE